MVYRNAGTSLLVILGLFMAGCALTPGTRMLTGEFSEEHPMLEPRDRETYRTLILALNENPAQTIAGLIDYPLALRIGKKLLVIENSAEFVSIYKRAMPKELRTEILSENPDEVLINWKGVAPARGRIWICGGKIVSLTPSWKNAFTAADDAVYMNPQGRRIIRAAHGQVYAHAVEDLKTVLPIATVTDDYFFLNDEKGRMDDWAHYDVYVTDANNDGRLDYVVVQTSRGSGSFRTIHGVWSKLDDQLVRLPLERDLHRSIGMRVREVEDGLFDWSRVSMYLPFPFLIEKDGTTYIGIDDKNYYRWKSGTVVRADPALDQPLSVIPPPIEPWDK